MREFTTPRLILREFEPRDSDALFQMESDPEMVRYQSFGPRTRESAADYVQRAIEAQSETPRNWFEFAICLTKCGTFIGRAGAEVEGGGASLWYAIAPSYQGLGYAKEAVGAMIDQLCQTVDGLAALKIECDPRNTASWKLAESLGFALIHEVEGALQLKGEWVSSRLYRKSLGL